MQMIINSLTKDSINLYIIGAKLMGLEISALFQTPFLNSGEAYPIFQYCVYIFHRWFSLKGELKV